MNAIAPPSAATQISALARGDILEEGGASFRCAWEGAVFIHYRVNPAALRKFVPFELDLRDGHAYISLVAFTMRDMTPVRGGNCARLLTAPIATHRFLNVRTYVRQGDERGIYFLAEWLTCRPAVLLGPRIYGLPYRLGDNHYDHEANSVMGSVAAGGRELRYSGNPAPDPPRPTDAASLDEFLMERYIAFTKCGSTRRMFRVWHEPWRQVPVELHVENDSLIAGLGDWFKVASYVGANYSPGAAEVWLGWPKRLDRSPKSFWRWVPLLVVSMLAIALGRLLPPWAFMCALAAAVFSGFKLLTLSDALATKPTTLARALSYLFAWPGMDARSFLDDSHRPPRPAPKESFAAIGKVAAGWALIWLGARLAYEYSALLASYIGLAGVILLLHFGLFHLLSVIHRHRGISADPIMNRPLLAGSLADFWGRRWNTAFRDLTHTYIFKPLSRRVGLAWAMLSGFAASGLVHDLVISLPAVAGFGLPIAYFLLQGVMMLLERRLRRPMLRRSLALVTVVAPAVFLFHPPFVMRVFLPLLSALRAI